MNDIVDQLLVKLKVISKIKNNEKVEINSDKISLHEISYVTSLLRYLRGDSRDKTVSYISEVVNHSIDVLLNHINSNVLQLSATNRSISNKDDSNKYEYTKHYTNLVNITEALKSATEGLENLRNTYEQDVQTSSQIEVIINKIYTHVKIAEDVIGKINK